MSVLLKCYIIIYDLISAAMTQTSKQLGLFPENEGQGSRGHRRGGSGTMKNEGVVGVGSQ